MTRIEAISIITAKLADLDKLDDAVLAAVAEALQKGSFGHKPLRALSAHELGLLQQSKADFAAGSSYSLAEFKTKLDDELAPLGVPRSMR